MIVAGSADSIDVGMSTSPSPGSIDDNGSSTSAELSSSRTRRSASDQLCILGSPYLGAEPLIFDPCSLSPNGWMDQDAAWYEGRRRPRPHCVTWGPSIPSPQKKNTAPIFCPCLLSPNGRPSQLLLSACIYISHQSGNHIFPQSSHVCHSTKFHFELELDNSYPTFEHHTLCIASTYYASALHTAF